MREHSLFWYGDFSFGIVVGTGVLDCPKKKKKEVVKTDCYPDSELTFAETMKSFALLTMKSKQVWMKSKPNVFDEMKSTHPPSRRISSTE